MSFRFRFLKRFLANKVKTYLENSGYKVDYKNPLGVVPNSSFDFRQMFHKVTSYSQQGEDLVLDRILCRKLNINLNTYKGLYVDAGAYHPISHSTTYLLYKRGWEGVCVDISQKSCDIIKKVRPRDHVVNAATSDIDGVVYFKDNNSISLIHESTKQQVDGYKPIRSFRLTTILNSLGINRQIDYLNIDTEGAEIQTLKGLDFKRFYPTIISVEIHADDIFEALKTEVAEFLFQQDYKCVGCNVITYFL
ncbi:MAG: FkbM family methyltransferase [Cyclobacteriaceae bacterium]|nr:FkbM family methyltransferase [Cyclobacteriaceae bacterium]